MKPEPMVSTPSSRSGRSRWPRASSRRAELRHGFGLVFDRELSPNDLDAVWTLTSTEVYDELTGERGWSPDQYRTWITNALPRMFD
jgi:hypothetical protein